MQGINNELTLNADMVKFCEIYCGSLHTKSHLLIKCSNYGAMHGQFADLFPLTDSIYSMYKYTV